MSKAERYQVETMEIAGVKVTVTSYEIDGRFYCHVANLDPGATIARADAATREEAIQQALEKVAQRLSGAAARRR